MDAGPGALASLRPPSRDRGTGTRGVRRETETRGLRLAGRRRAAAARPWDLVLRILPRRPGRGRHHEDARGGLPTLPARALPSGHALPMQLRSPERLLRDLLHVHVVPRDREGPVLEIPGGRDDPRPEGRPTVPRDDPRPGQPETRGRVDRGLPRTTALLRRLRELAEPRRPVKLGRTRGSLPRVVEGLLESLPHGR